MSTNESERHGVAFIFPGQGAQAVGMGADLYESSQAARSVFKKVDEAVSLIEGVRIDSEKIVDSEIYFNFGVVYARDGQFQKAINNYRLALNQNPNYNQAWFNMGLAYERLGDSQTSTLCFKEFLTRWEGDLGNPFIVEAKRLIAKQNSP